MRSGRRIPARAARLAVVLFVALLIAVSGLASAARAAPVDQSFVAPGGFEAVINECCAQVAQTFYAGRTGRLTAVNVDVEDAREFSEPTLRVGIWSTEAQQPSSMLTEAVVNDDRSPLTNLITFPRPAPVIAGELYAIVVSYDGVPLSAGRQGFWIGAPDNQYPSGDLIRAFPLTDGSVEWSGHGDRLDAHFRTYVEDVPMPTTRGQCKRGGYAQFGFKKQGQCIRFVKLIPGPPPYPVTKEQCTDRGWTRFGFKNETRCLRFVRLVPKP